MMKFLALGALFCCCLALTNSQDPECPLTNCLPGWRAGCLITAVDCQCFCVKNENPCQFIVRNFQGSCASNQFIDCNPDVSPCLCRCAPKLDTE
ncbi:hypothetical protein MRX96_045671 [Rhipicephalus microplus]